VVSDFQLTQLDLKHLVEVAELDRLCNPNPFSSNQIEQQLTSDKAVAFGVFAGQLIAYILCDKGYEVGEIVYIAVAPSARGKGVGRVLVDRACSYFREAGCHSMLLEVRSSNAAAIGLYKGVGFRVSGVRKGYYANPVEDALLMDLPLCDAKLG
jgi:[ribosomal protein S18]-alanine N-acetyltransferase